MRQFFFLPVSMLAFVLCLGSTADLPAQPPLQAKQGRQPMIVQPARASLPQLMEELESLEAQRETKKAYVKAAEIGVKAAELTLGRTEKLVGLNAISKEDLEKTKLDLDAAKAQVEIRMAEMKEVEVRIKHAKRKLDARKMADDPVPPKAKDPGESN